MSTARRFEHREHGHFKFWTIRSPKLSVDDKGVKSWTNVVTYGKIGTDGKDHFNTFWSEYSADAHYSAKVKEKLKKGYKEITAAAPKPVAATPAVKPKPVCQHLQLRKKNSLSWECNSCKALIEFDKPQSSMGADVIGEDDARRFFDLSAFQQD